MNRATRPWQRAVAFSTAAACVIVQLALPPYAEASHVGSSTASAGSVPPPGVSAVQGFQPDLFTGRATTSIPIAVPPGRKGMQPSLALTYSSSGRNGWLGVGWNLDLGHIERSTKNGVPKYDASDAYTFMFQGVTSELVQVSAGTYRAKDEGLFLRFEDKGLSGWEVRDKSGTRYLFGQTAASQIVSSGNIFRWTLDQVIDTNSNGLTITYTKDGNQLYPARIVYTTHASATPPPANQVDFILEAGERPDVDISYRAGFEIRTAKRLDAVEAKATVGGALSLARRYDLVYRQSAQTGRSLLSRVTQLGSDGVTSLPATSLTYQDASAPSYTVTANNPPTSTVAWNIRRAALDTGHENFGCAHPYAGLPWTSPTVVSGSANFSCLTASVTGNGSVSMSGCQDTFGHAYTFVYVSSARTISVPLANGSDVDACLWREDAGGVQNMGAGGSVPLQAGWSVLHVTGYHQHQGWGPLWINASLTGQVDLISPSQFLKPQLAGDANGDGVTDLITFNTVNGTWSVALSRNASFSPETTWLMGFGGTSSVPLLGDWNADGQTDIAIYSGGSWQFATSTATAFQRWAVADLPFGSGTPVTGDFTGDGIVDIGTYNAGAWRIALGNGSGFAAAASFDRTLGSAGAAPLTGDFNGDGLTDIAAAEGGTVTVALSTGSSFAAPATWMSGFGTANTTSADFNGDGLTDVAYYDKSVGQVRYAASTGAAFGALSTLPVTFGLRSSDDGLQVGDFNGDGLADPAVANGVTGNAQLAHSQGQFVDLLSAINNGVGGETALAYQPSTQCDNVCPIEQIPKLPFVLPVVSRVTLGDGLGNSYTTTYFYRQGRYDAPSREFRGFAHVEVRDAGANITSTEFHQDEHTKGRPFRTELHDAEGNLWTKTDHAWSCDEPHPGVHFARLDQTDAFTYDGDATFRQVRTRFVYDEYGNVTASYEDGEPSVIGDERSSRTTFANDPIAWLLGKPTLTQTLDAQAAVVAQRRFTYGDPAGNLTKEEEWLNATPEQWLATTLTYDAYGNVKTVTDAATPPRTTTNDYDPTGTYLVKITNTLGHTRELTYDPRFGQVTISKDANGVIAKTASDALGRAIQTSFIHPVSGAEVITSRTDYDLGSVPSHTMVHARIGESGAAELTTHTFTDGLGRTIQTRAPAEDPTLQVVIGAVEFNARGLVSKQWAPYLEASSTVHVPVTAPATRPAPPAPPVQYTYDPLGRLTSTVDPAGSTTSTIYDDWAVTSIDANGHQTRRISDAHSRLIAVEEYTGADGRDPLDYPASPYQLYATTRYQYDALNNLTQVTDTQGNITRITYDSLGRKVAMDDPDMGAWSYAYDAVDNLTSQTDAREVTTSFIYDQLNRLTEKRYSIPANSGIANPGTVTYTYDGANDPSKPFTKSKLTRVTDGSGSSSFEYDHLGRLVKESKTVDGTTYTVQRVYDLLGRLTALTYPDNEIATYTYNPQGGIETVSLQPVAGSPQPIVTGADYNPAGQLERITYGNGVSTDYSYDPQTLRLNTLTTDGPSGPLQNFAYEFDAAGNVLRIDDAVHSGTQSFEYDALSRLTRANGSYGDLRYAYDPLGNMTEKEGVQMAYGAGAAGPHAVTSTSTGWQMTYDANGNMVGKAVDPRAQIKDLTKQLLAYDAENRLVNVDTSQDETVTVTFKPGWNFFSLPVIPDDGAVAVLLPSFAQDFEQIAKFEPATNTFKHYVGNPKFDAFTELEYGVGYQVYCKRATDVTVSIKGRLPTTRLSKNLSPGWHLLSATTIDQSVPLSSWLSGVSYGQVKVYDPATQMLATATQAEKGKAYWVQVTAQSTWSPPLPKDVKTTYAYDGDGGKVKQTTASGTTTYLGEVYEQAPDGKLTKHVFAGSLRIATVEKDGSARTSLFYHPDHLGSSNVVTDETGTRVELTEHQPFGAISRHEGPKDLAHKFTGQRQDTTNGLVLFPARTYDPQLGRFLQPDPFVQDPADPQTLNRYAYVRNNPINLVDPNGYGFWSKFFGAIAAAVTFVATGGNVAAAAGVFGAVDSGISTAQAGGSASDIFKSAAIGFTAGFVGASIGAGISGDLGGGFIGGSVGGAIGGAAAGTVGAALRGGKSGRGAAAGAITGGALGGITGAFGQDSDIMGSAAIAGTFASQPDEAAKQAFEDFGVSPTAATLVQIAQNGQGGAQLLGQQGLSNRLVQRLTPNNESEPGSNNQRLRAGLLTALSVAVEYGAEKLPAGTGRGIVKVAGAGLAVHGAFEAGAAGLSSLAFAIAGPTPPFPPHVRIGAAAGGVSFGILAYNNLVRARHLYTSGMSEIYGKAQ